MSEKIGFSRRHVTAEAHIAAQHNREERIQRWLDTMEENEKARAKRSAPQQLALLDKRLGKGKGARKERARLQKQIENKKTRKSKKKDKN